jgi:TPR repeat protein
MVDIAHDASGPALPKPGGIAPQQASRPDSPDTGRLRVFISYSRDDANFADQLEAALDTYGFETSIDRHGVSGGEEWKSRLGNLISEADTVVFVLTPISAGSPICRWEVEEAERLAKRILPVICRPLEGASPPPQLRERNYTFFYDNPKEPGSGFGTGLAKLVAALNTDFDWLREHTRYLQRATEWDRGGRDPNRLLSGGDIADARAWATHRPKNAPEPTALHLDFIRASEEEAQARANARRKQLEEMAAAQAERALALDKAEEAQRKRATIRNAALAVVSMFAVLAGWLWVRADQARIRAVEAQKVAEEQKEQADQILGSATTIILNLEDKIDITTQKEVFAVYQTGANRGNEGLMVNLGNLYAEGFGVAKDYSKARKWYQKAADKGLWAGMASLARLYRDGLGVAQDYVKAREWYEKAADKDGSGETMAILGIIYANGNGVARDYAKAREWYEKAADKGSRTAMHNLGLAYEYGLGVAQDYAKAREWYENAAGKGNAEAMLKLGMLYYGGEVVAKDYAKAHEWYEKAAEKGDATAMTFLGAFYYDGKVVAKDYVKAREWYQKAADKGVPMAMASLARLYRDGLGVAQDYAKALQWQEAYAAKVEPEELGKSGEETALILVLAWYALFVGQFTKALTASDRAHALLPDDLSIETNRAHARMFNGYEKESRALYVAYKGKPLKDGQLWERVIAEDFAEFRKAGLTHPMMAEIEKELGVDSSMILTKPQQ